jgi:hypothetical protein
MSPKCYWIDNRLDMFHVIICIIATPYSLAMLSHIVFCYLYNCNSLFTCLLCHKVFIFTHMLSTHFSAFFTHYPRYNTLAVRTRNCRLLERHFRDVTLTPAKIADITLSRMTLAPAAIFHPGIGIRSRK